jgi:diguanylate cyclase (GGDEF)-like protein
MDRARQILDAINQGIVVLDRELRVQAWSRWMAVHSAIAEEAILGKRLFDVFPTLDTPVFNRSCRAVFAFGNFAFFSQRLHRFLFPMQAAASRQQMQQSCVVGPIRDGEGRVESIFLTVQDVTELVEQEQKLLQMNSRDGLTGVFNRRYLDHRLEVELERFRRYGRPLSVLIADVDHFKRVNDEHGHPCGDAVLAGIAEVLVRSVRKADVVARYGGEEFCCVLPETELAGALVVAEKLRAAVEAQVVPWKEQALRVTVSLGAAQALDHAEDAKALVGRADAGLYAAKAAGRNRVVAAGSGKPACG